MTEPHPTGLTDFPVSTALIQKAAYHEAGHAVAAFYKACPIKDVSILPGTVSVGKSARKALLSRIGEEEFITNEDIIRRNRGRIQDAIFISLAGPFAQRRFDPNSDWNDDREYSDFDEVSELIGELGHRGEVATAFRQYMEASITEFIDLSWPMIEAVAHRLAERRTITRDEMTKVVAATAKTDLARTARKLGLDL
jgi:hypothetical protein